MRHRKIVSFDEQLSARPLGATSTGAFCYRCRKATDSERIIEERRGLINNGVVIRVSCHGAEEENFFPFGSSEWDERDIRRAVQRFVWFNPSHIEMGAVHNRGRIND